MIRRAWLFINSAARGRPATAGTIIANTLEHHGNKHMLVYAPRGTVQTTGARASRQALDNLAGKVIGFIDNAKPNFNHLVDDIAELLIKNHGAVAVRKYRKRGPNIPASDAVMRELQEHTDLVITGSAE